LIGCMVRDDCLGEDASKGFLQCCVLPFAPCGTEFEEATEAINVEEILSCFDSAENLEGSAAEGAIRGVPTDFTTETIERMSSSDHLELVLCLMRSLLPEGAIEKIEILLDILKKLFNFIFFVLDIIENGIKIPGELILFVFGWAEFEDGEFDAPYKWFYCLTSVVIFLSVIEFIKLFAVTFIVWTKR
jgi:hypothetical protein